MTELENDHDTYNWFSEESSAMLKGVGEKSEEEWSILQGLRISPHKIFTTKDKTETLQWKKPGSQSSEVNFTNSGTNWHHVPPERMQPI